MWSIDTPWFDVALVGTGFAVGSILFGCFEERRSRWHRLLKLSLVFAITLILARTFERRWAYEWMLLPGSVTVWVHLVWLPRNGISGWTAEPKAEYLALVRRARLRDLFRGRGDSTP